MSDVQVLGVGMVCGAFIIMGMMGWLCWLETRRMAKQLPFQVDDRVAKSGGDYKFKGTVRAVFNKRTGQIRVVVENEDGILHIFNPTQLTKTVS